MKEKGLYILLFMSMALLMSACGEQKADIQVATPQEEVGILYVTTTATYEDISLEEKIDCVYKQSNQYNLSFGLDGYRIESVDVKTGDMVEKGQRLASLDVSDIEKEIPQLQHTMAGTQLKLQQVKEQKEYDLEAAYILYSYGKMETKDKDALKEEQKEIEKQYRDNIQDLEDQLTVDTQRYEAGSEQLKKGVLYAPASGEVTYAISDEKGGTSDINQNVVTISDLSGCYFACYDMDKIQYIQEGAVYQVQCADFGKYSYYNVVPFNRDKWEEEQCMQFAFEDDINQVKLGTRGTVVLSIGERKNVLCVPSKAIHQSEKGSFIYVLEDGQRKIKEVEVGLSGKEMTEIVGGLSTEDQIITNQILAENNVEEEGEE